MLPKLGFRTKVACEFDFPLFFSILAPGWLIGHTESNAPHSYLDDLPRVAGERYIPTNGK